MIRTFPWEAKASVFPTLLPTSGTSSRPRNRSSWSSWNSPNYGLPNLPRECSKTISCIPFYSPLVLLFIVIKYNNQNEWWNLNRNSGLFSSGTKTGALLNPGYKMSMLMRFTETFFRQEKLGFSTETISNKKAQASLLITPTNSTENCLERS